LTTSFIINASTKFDWMELNLRPGNPNHVTPANGIAPFGWCGSTTLSEVGFSFFNLLCSQELAHRTLVFIRYSSFLPRLRVLQESADSLIRFHRLTGTPDSALIWFNFPSWRPFTEEGSRGGRGGVKSFLLYHVDRMILLHKHTGIVMSILSTT